MFLSENGLALGLVSGFQAVRRRSWGDPHHGLLQAQAFPSSPSWAHVTWSRAELTKYLLCPLWGPNALPSVIPTSLLRTWGKELDRGGTEGLSPM